MIACHEHTAKFWLGHKLVHEHYLGRREIGCAVKTEKPDFVELVDDI